MMPVLSVSQVEKRFGGVVALRGADLEVEASEVHGLCGENGAGKSTLVKILGGLVSPDAGEVLVAGKPIRTGRRTDPRLVSIVHQELSIVPDLSVIDNVLLGGTEVGEIYVRSRFAADVRRHLDDLGLAHVGLNQRARGLSLAERQLVEITRGVSGGAKLLVLDEPTATLSDQEIQRVFAAIRFLRGRGTAVIFITHRLPEIFAITDRVTVYRNGSRVLTMATSELSPRELVRAMIGRDVASHEQSGAAAPGAEPARRLELTSVSLPGAFAPLDLSVAGGEIVAVVGQLGSGADQIVQTLAGLKSRYEGRIALDGVEIRLNSVRAAITAGVAYVPEDRAGKGVFLEAIVQQNLTVSVLDRLSRFGWIDRRLERESAEDLARDFEIDPRRLPNEVAELSGGNQQKVALAKAAALKPRLLVLNEPTRGVDIGARSEIYGRLRAMTASGLAIVFFTTDLEEVLELADRVVTVFRGRAVGVAPIRTISMDRILYDILHGCDAEREAA